MNRQKITLKKGLALVLALALALCMTACGGDAGSSSGTAEESSAAGSPASSETGSQAEETAETAGEGAKSITLEVVHGDGSTKEFAITTDAETLGDALVDEGLIAGEAGAYGLYVKTVDGETVDDGNQEWWCLTKGGEMWNNSVDSTEIADGDVYEFTFTVGY